MFLLVVDKSVNIGFMRLSFVKYFFLDLYKMGVIL